MTPAARTASTLKTTSALFGVWCLGLLGMGIAQAADCTQTNTFGNKTVYYQPTGTVSKFQDASGNTSIVVRNLRPALR
jgi:hypothetical protein